MKNFEYKYTQPCLDWYCYVDVIIEPKQFDFLMLERRYGHTWWLLGYKRNETKEEWDSTQIGEIYNYDIARLIEWCEESDLKLTARPLTSDIDIIKPCYEIYKCYLTYIEKKEQDNA